MVFSCFKSRIRRDELKYKAVCSELDKTDDTAFVAMIVTRNPGRLLCMGSIIDEYHVLTAKRCFEKNDASGIMIIAGYQSPYYGKNSQVKFAEKVVKHDQELAVLVLKKPFVFSDTVKSIRLIGTDKITEEFKSAYQEPFKKCGIVGIEIPKYLQQGDYLPKLSSYNMMLEPFMDVEGNCTDAYTDIMEIEKRTMFCTTGKSEFCWTAIGSPSVIMMDKSYVQIGVVVMGMCKTSKPTAAARVNTKAAASDKSAKYTPNVHIRTDKFHKWIKANSHLDIK